MESRPSLSSSRLQHTPLRLLSVSLTWAFWLHITTNTTNNCPWQVLGFKAAAQKTGSDFGFSTVEDEGAEIKQEKEKREEMKGTAGV